MPIRRYRWRRQRTQQYYNSPLSAGTLTLEDVLEAHKPTDQAPTLPAIGGTPSATATAPVLTPPTQSSSTGLMLSQGMKDVLQKVGDTNVKTRPSQSGRRPATGARPARLAGAGGARGNARHRHDNRFENTNPARNPKISTAPSPAPRHLRPRPYPRPPTRPSFRRRREPRRPFRRPHLRHRHLRAVPIHRNGKRPAAKPDTLQIISAKSSVVKRAPAAPTAHCMMSG